MTISGKPLQRDPEQLLLDFTEVTHIPITYINNSLSAVGTQSQITESVHTLLKDLEDASESASRKLNVLVDDMLRTAPRLGYDVEVLRGSLHNLHEVVDKAEPKREVLSKKGDISINKLAMLAGVKAQMQETQKVFTDARAWNPPEMIEDSIAGLISAKEYAAASKELVFYEDLLHVFKGTSEYVRRRAVIDRIRKKLMDVKQDGLSKVNLDVTARSSIDTQRSTGSVSGDDSIYSSFIKRAFKT